MSLHVEKTPLSSMLAVEHMTTGVNWDLDKLDELD
jgi:hypothetical protein